MPDQWIFDSNLGRNRPSSAAFEDCPDGDPMSSFWKEKHISCGLAVDHILRGHEGFFVARFKAGLARELKNIVHPDPLSDGAEEEHQPAHVLVVGEKHKKRFSKRLACEADWEVEPT